MNNINRITVVGGGTSGCVSALILKKRFPQCSIEIISSSKIGIIGVGEGSTEHWAEFCRYVGIDHYEVIRECGATFKNGIYYDNWNTTPFMHSVIETSSTDASGYYYKYAHLISNKKPKKELQPDYIWENRCLLHHFNHPNDVPVNQFHFDTFKLNKFLHKKCIQLGINIIDDEIIDASLDSNGNIECVHSNTKNYYADFYVDCSGFKRLLLHKTLNVKWKSYSEYLPLNSAIAFPTEEMEEYNMWTKATAHDAGWGWTIPVQGRTGNGYVFSDKFITKDKAHEEMEKYFGKKLDVAKEFKFDPGRLEKFWEKNCVAIGLSSNFVEPLEATSIGNTIQQTFCLMNFLSSYDSEHYNNLIIKAFDNIVDYILAHYLVKKENTDFWKEIKYNLKITDSLQNLLTMWKNRLPHSSDVNVAWGMFSSVNYISILYGLDWFDIEAIKREYSMFPFPEYVEESIKMDRYNEHSIVSMGHKKIIQMIKDN
jgi:tryptophan halogenase